MADHKSMKSWDFLSCTWSPSSRPASFCPGSTQICTLSSDLFERLSDLLGRDLLENPPVESKELPCELGSLGA